MMLKALRLGGSANVEATCSLSSLAIVAVEILMVLGQRRDPPVEYVVLATNLHALRQDMES